MLPYVSIVYGQAFEVPSDDPIANHPSVRTYRLGDGRLFVGSDTDEIGHACNHACAILSVGSGWTPTVGPEDSMSYVVPETGATVEIVGFDPGDDPYILCDSCGAELLRDDGRFEAEYGHPIGGTTGLTKSTLTLF